MIKSQSMVEAEREKNIFPQKVELESLPGFTREYYSYIDRYGEIDWEGLAEFITRREGMGFSSAFSVCRRRKTHLTLVEPEVEA